MLGSSSTRRSIRRELFRIPGVRPISTALALWRIARTDSADDPDGTLRRLEAVSGLVAGDYACRARLEAKLRWTTGRARDLVGVPYVLTLTGSLGMLRRTMDGLRVLEVFLGVTESDYADLRGLATKLRRRLSATPDQFGVTLLFGLVGALHNVGRVWESIGLLRADLGLVPPDIHTTPQRRVAEFARAVTWRLGPLSPDAVAMYLDLLVLSLDELGVGDDGLPVLERFVGLQEECYASRASIEAAVRPWLDQLTAPVNGVLAIAALAAALDSAGHGDRCLALVEWHLGVDPDDYRDIDTLAAKWRAVRAGPVPDVGLTLWRVWGDTLVSEGRPADALAVIEADSGLRESDLDDPARFGPKLLGRLAAAQVDTAAAYVLSLVDDLAALGRSRAAARVAEWYLLSHTNLWSVPDDGDPAVRHVVPLLTHWLSHRRDEQADFAWRLCEQVVGYLRASMLLPETTIHDRREFIGHVENLRVHVRVLGMTATEEQRVLRGQLWDAELGQRLLFERFVLTTVRPIAPAEAPVDQWPLRAPEPVDFAGHLPDPAACRDEDMRRMLGTRRYPRIPVVPVAEEVPLADRWLAEIETTLRAGVTPRLLAAATGTRGVLVRAGFRPDGALFWAAISADGENLRLVAAGAGTAGDRDRLRWASFRHDIGLLLTSGTARHADVLAKCLDTLLSAVDHNADGWYEPALAVLAESTIAADEGLAGRIGALCAQTTGTAELRALANTVATYRDTDPAAVMARIDDVTRDYLREVAGIWSLTPLVNRLDPDTDVLFQLEDVLRSVPVAHLPCDGTPLYTRVRSTRVSLSLLLTILQTRVEAEFATDAPRLLALSHFGDDGDRAAAGSYATWLHHGQRWLARESDATCLNAAERPRGAAGALRVALERHREFQVVTVCGHGSAEDAGMVLADGLWRGDGCDWRSVNLLILASCSVGRLEQVADRDVEGLCVRLALHRARSVLACRWPVIAPQAIAFANEVVACYLRLREEDPGGPGLRARAVNEARHRFLRGDVSVPGAIVRLNTVAAFELFGLG
jgi:hypothetical protein